MLYWPQKALLYLSFFNWLLIYEKTSRSTKKREKIQDKIKMLPSIVYSSYKSSKKLFNEKNIPIQNTPNKEEKKC